MKFMLTSFLVILLFFSCESGDSGRYSTQSDYVKLYGEAIAPGDAFGYSVALSGDILVVGATQDDDQGTDSGAAYVFTGNPDTSSWEQTQKLISPGETEDGHNFGYSLSIDGATAVVGSQGETVYV